MGRGLMVWAALAWPLAAAGGQRPVIRIPIDSGRLVRLRRAEGLEKGRLLVPFTPSDSVIVFCRYPAPPCDTQSDTTAIRHLLMTQVRAIEIQHGTKAGTGALIGGLLGLVLGSAVDGLEAALCESDCHRNGYYTARYILVLGLGGGLIGANFPRWRAAP